MITIAPSMTVQQIADLLEQHQRRDTAVYVRIESCRGRPIAYMVREDNNYADIPPFLRQTQAE
jgi:hypothetical protein